jgi:hypothetical protein
MSAEMYKTILRLEAAGDRLRAQVKTLKENHKKDGRHILAGIEKGNDINWIRAWASDIANGKGHGGIQS